MSATARTRSLYRQPQKQRPRTSQPPPSRTIRATIRTGRRTKRSRRSPYLPQAAPQTPTYAAVGSLPAGISFNTTTRVISGTPTAVGSGTITIRATNSEGNDDWTVDYATTAATTGDSVTVALTGLQEFTNYIRWPDNVDIGATFAADGVAQEINFVDLNNASPAGRVSISIVGFNNRFTPEFEATGLITFEASDGEMLEVQIANADMTETYAWTPTNSAEVVAFIAHVKGLTDQDAMLTLSE